MEGSSTTIRLIREKLSEVVGSRIAVGVSDTRIWQLIQLYGEEEEGTNCALHTLLEEVFEEEDNFHEEEEQGGFVVFGREEIASRVRGLEVACGGLCSGKPAFSWGRYRDGLELLTRVMCVPPRL